MSGSGRDVDCDCTNRSPIRRLVESSDEDQQDAPRTPLLEPLVVAAVDLSNRFEKVP
jgi:hypothetical protein